VALAQLLELARALQQEAQLCRQRVGAAVLVEALQKRVVLGLFQQRLDDTGLEPWRD
jgi:hypothetical protein